MASVAKWLRQWIVVPPFAGSSPVVRPMINYRVNGTFTLEWLNHNLDIRPKYAHLHLSDYPDNYT